MKKLLLSAALLLAAKTNAEAQTFDLRSCVGKITFSNVAVGVAVPSDGNLYLAPSGIRSSIQCDPRVRDPRNFLVTPSVFNFGPATPAHSCAVTAVRFLNAPKPSYATIRYQPIQNTVGQVTFDLHHFTLVTAQGTAFCNVP